MHALRTDRREDPPFGSSLAAKVPLSVVMPRPPTNDAGNGRLTLGHKDDVLILAFAVLEQAQVDALVCGAS